LDIVITLDAEDTARLGEQAAREGYDRLFVAGGDGTINEVLNGVARVEGGLDMVSFGILPFGTGNDFARALGIPEDIDSALDVLSQENTIAVDVGLVNERRFINVSAGGFIAEVSDAVSPELKTVAGKLAYLIGGTQVLLGYEPVGLRFGFSGMAADADNSRATRLETDLSVQLFAVCNAPMVGGGRLIAPTAVINDGLFEVCVVKAMPTLEFVAMLRRVAAGEHLDDDRVLYFQARELDLAFDRAIKINTDGQVLSTESCSYRILPQAARFLTGNRPH
jgi:diacylglycerol kinase (ATP)